MSDSDDETRLLATQTFATLIKLVPLEVRSPGLFFSLEAPPPSPGGACGPKADQSLGRLLLGRGIF